METKTSSNTRLAAAILGGAAVGALLGILFAPDKGSVTRTKIADTTRRTGERVKHRVKDIYESITGSSESVNEHI